MKEEKRRNLITAAETTALILLLFLSIVALNGCGMKSEKATTEAANHSETFVAGASQEAATDNVPSSQETAGASSDTVSDKMTNEENETASSLYQNFLDGRTSVHINPDREADTGYEPPYNQIHTLDYTLDDLVDQTVEDYTRNLWEGMDRPLSDPVRAEIALIDCGNDGVPELLLHISVPTEVEEWERYFIIKDIGGSLETVYSRTAWSRSGVTVNQYGYISGDASGGFNVMAYDRGFVDDKGTYQRLYYLETTGFAASEDGSAYLRNLYVDGRTVDTGENVELGDNPQNYLFLDCAFDSKSSGSSDHLYSFIKEDEFKEPGHGSGVFSDADESLYDESTPLMKLFRENGIDIRSISDINKFLLNRETEIGFRGDLDLREEPSWKLVKSVGTETESAQHDRDNSSDNDIKETAERKTTEGTGLKPEKVSDTEDSLREMLTDRTGLNILAFQYADYNGDGEYEAFAEVSQELPADAGGEAGEVSSQFWFVSSNGASCVLNSTSYWNGEASEAALNIMSVGGKKFVTQCETGGASGQITHLYGVNDKGWYQVKEPYGYLIYPDLSDDRFLEVYCDTYDAVKDLSGNLLGHTYKPYYFYYDGSFHEFGASSLTIDQFNQYQGASDVLSGISSFAAGQYGSSDVSIEGILLRSNGLIHVNFSIGASDGRYYYYDTLRVSNGAVVRTFDAGSYFEGQYQAALFPDIAVYPE